MFTKNFSTRQFSRICTLIFMLCSVTLVYSQSGKSVKLDNDEIAALTSKLSKKIILNEAQTKQVSAILTEYSKELDVIRNPSTNSAPDEIKMKQLMSGTADKINSVLDEKQKMKYDIIKNDWWKEINSEAND